MSPDLLGKLATLQLLVCDVDGVLTDGRLTYAADGEATKTFHVHDGMGLRLLMENGVQVAIITARKGGAVARRMADLNIKHVAQGRGDKGNALAELLAELGIAAEHAAYIGDDVLDLPAIRRVGVGITVNNGHSAVIAEADWVTERAGGTGAVREVADTILEAKIGLSVAVEHVLDRSATQ